MSPRTKSYLLLLIATLIWGVAGPIIKFTEYYLPPVVFLLYRFAISAAVGTVILTRITNHRWPKSTGQRLGILVFSLLSSTVSIGLLFFGYEKTSALTASVLNSIYPILVSIVGVIFLHERVTRRENVGMGIALVGTAIVTLGPFFNGSMSTSTTMLGNLLVIASILVNVVVTVLTKLLLRRPTHPISLTQLSFIVGFITTLPWALANYSLSSLVSIVASAPLMAHVGVWYMALLSGTVAYSLWNIGQKTIEIGESSLFTYLYPVITLPLSLFWLHESITWGLIVGSAIITLGIILAESKKRKASR